MRVLSLVGVVGVLAVLAACPPSGPGPDPEVFDCHDIECDVEQACIIGVGGAAPPPGEDGLFPQCVEAPIECADEPTCTCLEAAGLCPPGPSDCDDESGDGVVCTIYYP